MEKHRAFNRLFMNDTMGFRARVKGALGQQLRETYQAYLAFLEQIFSEGIRKGYFLGKNPTDLMLGYTGIAFSLVTYYEETTPGKSLTRLIPRIEKIFYDKMGK